MGNAAEEQQRMKSFREPACVSETVRHPFFGAMSPNQWLRWGYLHTDHHLRQFGA